MVPTSLPSGAFELIASLGSTLRFPGPASGSIARSTNFDRSPCPERSAPTSRGGTSASVSATARPVTTVPATPADATVRNFLREKASSPDGSVTFSFLDVMRPAPLMWWLRSLGRGNGGLAGRHRLKFGVRARLKEGAGAVSHDQQAAGQQHDILQHEPPAG